MFSERYLLNLVTQRLDKAEDTGGASVASGLHPLYLS